jgi:hypothetical protein
MIISLIRDNQNVVADQSKSPQFEGKNADYRIDWMIVREGHIDSIGEGIYGMAYY